MLSRGRLKVELVKAKMRGNEQNELQDEIISCFRKSTKAVRKELMFCVI